MYRANSYCPEFAPVQKSRDNSSEHGVGIRQATVREASPSSVIVSCVSKSNRGQLVGDLFMWETYVKVDFTLCY